MARNFIQAGDRFARLLGIEILEERPGYAKTAMPVDDRHLNALNTVHGGAAFSLADLALAVASNSHGTAAVAVNCAISYLAPARQGAQLVAEAVETSKNHKLATYDVKVTDETGALIASMQGMVYRKKDPIPD
jgi:acyl-CoA thioesterase